MSEPEEALESDPDANVWYTIKQMVEILNISDNYFRRSILPKLQQQRPVIVRKRKGPQIRGKLPWEIYPRGALKCYFESIVANKGGSPGHQSGPRRKRTTDDEDSTHARTKQAIEEEKLRKIRRENELADRTAIPRDEIHDMFVKVAAKIRRGTEQLQKRFGAKAHKLIDDQIAEALESMEEMCQERELDTPAP